MVRASPPGPHPSAIPRLDPRRGPPARVAGSSRARGWMSPRSSASSSAPRTRASRIRSWPCRVRIGIYADRAVDDLRRLTAREQAIERLERSVQAYQEDRERLAAAYEQLTASLGRRPDATRTGRIEVPARTATSRDGSEAPNPARAFPGAFLDGTMMRRIGRHSPARDARTGP